MKKTSVTLIATVIRPDMTGLDALLPADQESIKAISKMNKGEISPADIYTIKDARSLEQLRLYWKMCTITAENLDDLNWSTKDRVDHNCKVLAGHVKDRYKIITATGEQYEMIIPDSISYANCEHLTACGYFTKAFEIMARKLKITVEELMDAVGNGAI